MVVLKNLENQVILEKSQNGMEAEPSFWSL